VVAVAACVQDPHAHPLERYQTRPYEDRKAWWTVKETVEPIIVDGEECFEVAEVLAERVHHRKRQLLVKWAGFDLLSATWSQFKISLSCLGTMTPRFKCN